MVVNEASQFAHGNILGFLNVDKPTGMTSHDVVARVRRTLGLKKVGHAGTLDPMASGVLVLCLGAATRLSEYVMQSDKQYRARVRLGITTDTYDAEGTIRQVRDLTAIQLADVERALSGFLGEIDQIAPMYSAIKQGGRKLYDLARAGQEIERQPRRVRIDALLVQEWSPPEFVLDVTCSAGTYIRSLAYDLGEALGVGAFLSGLVRLSSGTFALEDSVSIDELLTSADWQQYLIAPRTALANWPSVQLDPQSLEHLRQGRAVEASAIIRADTVFAYTPEGTLAAVLKPDDGLWRPDKVFL